MNTLTRTATGLIARPNLTTGAGLTLGPASSIDLAHPVLIPMGGALAVVCSVAQATALGLPTGLRESQMVIDTDLSTKLIATGGDGATGTAEYVWSPKLFDLASGGTGATTLVGDLISGQYKDPSDHSAGTWAATDFLWMYRESGQYYFYRLITSVASGDIPAEQYTSDTQTSSAATLAAAVAAQSWALACVSVQPAAGAFPPNGDAYMSQVRRRGGKLQAIYSTYSGGVYAGAIGTMTGPGSAVALGTASCLAPGAGLSENIKGDFSRALGTEWIVSNMISASGHFDSYVSLWISGSSSDYTTAPEYTILADCPLDNPGTNFSQRVGILTPFVSFAGDSTALVETPDGYIPCTYDGGGAANSNDGNQVLYTVLEPAAGAILYAPTSSGTATVTEAWASLANWTTDSTAGGAASVTGGVVSLGGTAGPTIIWDSNLGSVTATSLSIPLTSLGGNCHIGLGFGRTAVGEGFVLDIGPDSSNAGNFVIGAYHFSASLSGGYAVLGSSNTPTPYSAGLTPVVNLNPSTMQATVTLAGSTYGPYAFPAGAFTGDIFLRNGGSGTGDRKGGVLSIAYQTAGSAVASPYHVPAVHGQSWVSEACVEPIALASGGYVDLEYLIQASGDSARARVWLDGTSKGQILASSGGSGGTPGPIALVSPQTNGGTVVAADATLMRVKVVGTPAGSSNTQIQLLVQGELQATATVPFASGAKFGFTQFGAASRVRLLSLRGPDTITISGLSGGEPVVVYGHGPYPVWTGTNAAGSTSITVPVKHSPLYGVGVSGVVYPIAGGVWGGDSYTYSVAGSGSGGVYPPANLTLTTAGPYGPTGSPITPSYIAAAPADVRFGTPVGTTTGLCHVPLPSQTQTGVPVDASVGTFAGSGGGGSGASLDDITTLLAAGVVLKPTGLNAVVGANGWSFPQMLRALSVFVMGKRASVPAEGTAGTVTYSNATNGDYGTVQVDNTGAILNNSMTPPA